MPGGHQQFQMWYWDLIPLALAMTGFPMWAMFKLYHDIYPCRIHQPIVHHVFALALSAYLLTIGPNVCDCATTKQAKKIKNE